MYYLFDILEVFLGLLRLLAVVCMIVWTDYAV